MLERVAHLTGRAPVSPPPCDRPHSFAVAIIALRQVRTRSVQRSPLTALRVRAMPRKVSPADQQIPRALLPDTHQ
jgi:hypothetical protein